MPGWFVDLGRHLGGIVVFSLCALFSALALIPCYYAFLWVEYLAATYTTLPPMLLAVMSVPFLYGLWGWTFLAITVVYKRVIFYRPKEGEWPLFSWPVIGWGTTGALQNFGNAMFLMHWRGTTMLNLYMKAMGVKMGHRVTMNTIDVYDWDLITIEDDVIVGGGAVILGHLVEHGKMKMRPVVIKKGALVGTGARVMPGCTIEELGVLGAGSIMKKGSTVSANTIFGGTPAKLIRARGEKDVQDSGVAKDA